MSTGLENSCLVSAIVSTYNAERFLRGKLEDLEAQTIAQELEIIVIDSGSRQNERGIVEEFQRRYDNIRYIRTEQRETVYQAWNRGIREARGEFIANANTDDRLRRDCYEVLVQALREHPECVLAYPDMRITLQENGTFETHERHGFKDWPAFNRLHLMEICCVGPFPLWRRSLHDEIGYFDERYQSSADYEFWLRAALRHDFIHVPQFLGLYWMSPETVSRKGDLPTLEYLQVQKEYRPKYAAATPTPMTPTEEELEEYRRTLAALPADSPEALQAMSGFAELYPDWPLVHNDLAEHCYRREELGHAKKHMEKAALLDPACSLYRDRLQAFFKVELHQALRNYSLEATAAPDDLGVRLTLGMICTLLERHDAAKNHYLRALEIDPASAVARENLKALQAPELTSIVIVAGNGRKRVRACLESIERHTSGSYEVVVLDNGSCDGTLPWLRRFCAGKSRFTLIDFSRAVGYAEAVNTGMRRARGSRIVLLDSSVVVTPEWLTRMRECLEREGGRALVVPMSNRAAAAQLVAAAEYGSIEELERYARYFTLDHAGRRLHVDRLDGFALLLSRTFLEAVGQLDTGLPPGSVADDLCLRAALAGYRCVIAGDVFLHREAHPGAEIAGEGQGEGEGAISNFVGGFTLPPPPSGQERGSHNNRGNRQTTLAEKWDLARLEEPLARKVATHNALVKAKGLARRGLAKEAVDLLLQQGIACSPEAPLPYHLLAEIFIQAGEPQSALELLTTTPDAGSLAAILLEATALHQSGRDAEAIELADHALVLDPQSAATLTLKAELAAEKGDRGEAEALYKEAMLADPGFGPAFTGLAALTWETGEHQTALSLAEIGFCLSPLSMSALDRFHGYAGACQALPREERRVREAREIYPEHKGLAFGLIEILIRRGDYGEAIEEIQRCAAEFGLDDGGIDAALEIRRYAGDAAPAVKGTSSVSVCMIVKNEAEQLPAALYSVKDLADEVVLVDTGSTDRTCDIARIFGARVFSFPWTGNFSEARNFAHSKALGDWILIMDADEVFCPRDLPPVVSLLRRTHAPTAFSFPIRNYTWAVARENWNANSGEYPAEERGLGWTPSERSRLFPNDSRIGFQGAVHELLEPSIVACGIPIHSCDVPVHHYGKLDAVKLAEKHEHYYQLGLKKLAESGESFEALVELARQSTELNRSSEAEGLWHRVLERRPDCAEAYFSLGYLYLAAADYQTARSHAAKAVELAPDLKEALFNLAKCELFLGKAFAAAARSQEMLEKWPDYPPALSLLAATLLMFGKEDEAGAVLEKIRRMGFDCGDFLNEYAEGMARGNRGHLAEPLLECAARLPSGAVPGGSSAASGATGGCHGL